MKHTRHSSIPRLMGPSAMESAEGRLARDQALLLGDATLRHRTLAAPTKQPVHRHSLSRPSAGALFQQEAQAMPRCQWRSRNVPCPTLGPDDHARGARYRGVHIDIECTQESRNWAAYIVDDFRSDREGSCVWTNTRRREQVYCFRQMANGGACMLTKRNLSIPVRQS